MNIFNNNQKIILCLSKLLIIFYFLYLFLEALKIGGGWDLNEQIDFAQRLLKGQNIYANGMSDLFFPTSPYFPGVGYLSFFYSIIGLKDVYLNNVVMLFTAILFGLTFFVLIYRLSHFLYPNINKSFLLSALAILYITHFSQYKSYMLEFKPDTVILVFGLFIFLLIESKKKLYSVDYLIIGLLLFIISFFKQTSFIIYILTFLLIFINKDVTIRRRIYILFFYFIIGTFSLYLVFSTENLYFFTIKSMSQHSFDLVSLIIFLIEAIFDNLFFICTLLVYFMFFNFKKKNLIEIKYLLFCFLWLGFAILSGGKLGGNVGNVEVGLVVFLPFSIFSYSKLFEFIKKNNLPVICILLFLLCRFFLLSVRGTFEYIQKVKMDFLIIKVLESEFKNKNAFVDGSTYILAKSAGMNIITEANTLGHFNNIPSFDMTKIKSAIKNREYDLFFFTGDLNYYRDREINQSIDSLYKTYINSQFPDHKYKLLTLKSN